MSFFNTFKRTAPISLNYYGARVSQVGCVHSKERYVEFLGNSVPYQTPQFVEYLAQFGFRMVRENYSGKVAFRASAPTPDNAQEILNKLNLDLYSRFMSRQIQIPLYFRITAYQD